MPQLDIEYQLLQKLYEEFGGSLLIHVLELTGHDLRWAEDVLQETMIEALRNADGLDREPDLLRGWLRTAARRIVLDGWHSRQCRPQEVAEADEDFCGVPDDGAKLVARIKVWDALWRLPPLDRDSLVQVFMHGRTVHEAAAALGVPTGTVKARIYCAVRALRHAVREWGHPTETDEGGG